MTVSACPRSPFATSHLGLALAVLFGAMSAGAPAKATTSVGGAAGTKPAKPTAGTPSAKPAAGTKPGKPTAGATPAVPAIVQKVQARYDTARDFTAAFEQVLTQSATKRASRSAGKVTFKKPGKMRWDYTVPEPRMVLADGTRLWLWEPEDQQAFRQDLASSQLPAALAFLTGQGRLGDEFAISTLAGTGYGKPGEEVLGLVPKKPSAQVQRLVFVVEPATGFVRETIVFDAQGNTNDLVFTDIRVNTGVADALFSWSPPPGTRVIDPAARK